MTYVYPAVGPVSGGTPVIIRGGFFGPGNNTWEITFGNVQFQSVSNNETLIIAISPNVTNSSVIIDRPLSLSINSEEGYYLQTKSTNLQTNDHTFTYKRDPIIEKIEPLSTIIRFEIVSHTLLHYIYFIYCILLLAISNAHK